MDSKTLNKFDLNNEVCVITGGAGLLGVKHAEAIAECGGLPVIIDINEKDGLEQSKRITEEYNVDCQFYKCDITNEALLRDVVSRIITEFGAINTLINNAANNEKMEEGNKTPNYRLESIPLEMWNKDFNISVTGAFLCSRIIGPRMIENGGGVILNVSSDLGVIAPDQRVYYQPGVPEEDQIVKPVTYSIVKHALIGLTKYLSTYWIGKNIRVNTICPGGVYSGQPKSIVDQLEYRIPLGRMATIDEYKAAIVFLISEASAYMNGATVVMDGGRSTW